ncbi:hypothetical protein CHS0354_032949 [Potamilus streckersoni]|uniref:Uncharacterized protein n=1 Tax=Potamilus streckersoni TaxID=2493646 RepID=A0AAE0SIV2_9BIVA|nr:hypothetical protein CHS0354_032949 [Potamilus streckersoni]
MERCAWLNYNTIGHPFMTELREWAKGQSTISSLQHGYIRVKLLGREDKKEMINMYVLYLM